VSKIELTLEEFKMLEKGAVPRILQEVYYTCSSDGSKVIDIELTLEEFKDKLEKLQENK
tara:strand:+ start:295 stop:471 length:177 start_codon:yes stop_codon:yes gene_type:complete